jgi:hypothetical protein
MRQDPAESRWGQRRHLRLSIRRQGLGASASTHGRPRQGISAARRSTGHESRVGERALEERITAEMAQMKSGN